MSTYQSTFTGAEIDAALGKAEAALPGSLSDPPAAGDYLRVVSVDPLVLEPATPADVLGDLPADTLDVLEAPGATDAVLVLDDEGGLEGRLPASFFATAADLSDLLDVLEDFLGEDD